jgi:O-antigen ligase
LHLKPRGQQLLSITLATAIWLCPFWLQPTAIVPSLLWAAAALGGLLILDAFFPPRADNQTLNSALQKPFIWLLVSLAAMIAWRSSNLQNTLAASLCLICIGLAATLSAKADTARPARVIAWAWLLAGLCNGALGLLQYFGYTDEPLGMAFGFLRQRNNFATLCNISLIALIYLWHKKQFSFAYGKWLASAAGLLIAAALAATASRAGLLGLAAIALLIFTQKSLRKTAALAALGYCFYALVLPVVSGSGESIFTRVSSTIQNEQLQDSRKVMWSNTLSVISGQPIMGVGWRGIDRSLHLTDFGSAMRFPGQVDNAHNLPLQFAAELGVPFTAIWLLALSWLIVRNKPWQARSPEVLLGWGVLLVIGIHSLLEYPLWYAPFQIATGLAAGLVFTKKNTAQITNIDASASHIWLGLVGIGLIIFSTYAAYDFLRVRQLFIPSTTRAGADSSWLFAAQVRYAKLSTMMKTAENAEEVYALAKQVFHFSAEPWVLKVMIESGEHLAAHNAANSAAIAAEVAIYKLRLASIIATDQAAGLPTLK